MQQFEGRVAVITGAAGRIGLELAREAATLGMKLVLADVRVHPLEEASARLQVQGAQVLAMVCDVSRGRLVQELADAAVARFGAVHLVFNLASLGWPVEPVWETSEAEWERLLGVNLWGAIHGARIFTRLMLDCAARHAGYEGHIVNTAAMPAVLHLSETLQRDLRKAGAPIGVSVLDPGPPATPAAIARLAFEAVREGRFRVT